MIELGDRAGREVVCMLTDMDQPLGQAVGNALEIREAVATVKGEGPPDFSELVLASAAHLLSLSDLGLDELTARRVAEEAVADGSALSAYERWIEAQGGDPGLDSLPRAPVVREVTAPADGVVRRLGAIAIGHAALHLGAGRRTKEDPIDASVGIVCRKKRGDEVVLGDVLAEVHAADDASAEEAAGEVTAAYELADEPSRDRPIVLDTIA
jgi:pyrimidine-nucleoside phosphorylase